MSAERRERFFRRALLALWAMGTLVLVFCVVLLAGEMTRRGGNPLALPEPEGGASSAHADPGSGTSRSAREVTLYFAGTEGRLLAAEARRIESSSLTVENCRAVLDALIQGSKGVLNPILPPSTKVRALYLLPDGELVLDFSRELVLDLEKSTSAEALLVYGVVNTLTQATVKGEQQNAVRVVRFLIEGSDPEETFESHLDLSAPVGPDSQWLPVEEAPPANV